jgi:hypothetical protein
MAALEGVIPTDTTTAGISVTLTTADFVPSATLVALTEMT